MFMSSDGFLVPPAMARNLHFNKVLHEQVIVVTLMIQQVPRVARAERAKVERFSFGIYRVSCRFGFMLEAPSHSRGS